jgi:CheY-like chemotaxis protein
MARILVIDSDGAVRAAVKALLEYEGLEVLAVEDGRTGLALLETTRVDVVVVDIFMPEMHGLETVTAVHQHAPLVPIIAMSGFTFRDAATPAPDFLAMAAKLGAAYSLQKPFRPRDLMGAVQACLHQTPTRSPAA